jgi:hypothetical protein
MRGYSRADATPPHLIYVLYKYIYTREGMSEEFDIGRLRLGNVRLAGERPLKRNPPKSQSHPTAAPSDVPRHKTREHFLKGPVPLYWIAKAACCRGRALHVAAILWYRAGLENRRTVKIPRWVADKFGLSTDAKSRGLRALETAGLVSVKRQTGCSPVVTLLDGRDPE